MTTRAAVEAQYGPPSEEQWLTEAGRRVREWTYREARAPRGIERMVVAFGLLTATGFDPDVVRALTLYPRPGVFALTDVVAGWGTPDAVGTDERTGRPAFRYDAVGLLVVFEREGRWAQLMLFAPERPAARRP